MKQAGLFHLLRIAQVCVRHGLDDYLVSLKFFGGMRFVSRLLRFGAPPPRKPHAVRLREALEELGPVFVKFGQMLSTRPDLLPDDLVAELTRLQDDVPPFAGDVARRIVERAYGEPLAARFAEFDHQPFASASVAQVHHAVLHDGSAVVVKVIRPDIEKVIHRDLRLLYALAEMAARFWSEAPRLRPLEVVEEYDKTIHNELDLLHEAANASLLRANFTDSAMIYVPRIYFEHTRREVMVMERVSGIPIRDVDALRAAGIDLRQLAHNGVEIFFTQAFRDGFFHADMHPGNILVAPDGQYRAVDFGIMGSLGESDKRYLAENFLAFFRRDYRAVAQAHLDAGWVPPQTPVEEFEAAIRTVCEPIFARPIREISFGRFIVRLFQTARRFQMPVQPQLLLLQKTLLNIEGVGRALYPDLDLWQTAKPYLERWMAEQAGPRAAAKRIARELPRWGRIAPELPMLVYEVLRRAQGEDLLLRVRSDELHKLRREIRAGHRRQICAITGGILLAAAILTATLGAATAAWLAGIAGGVLLLLSFRP